ncbi:N-methylhydantoinase A/oxoprolinase/acetone carboxylase beta subunit [Caldanaerobacter subterraneus subsp. tengcongensis MB4]|uniref:N-methylhydaintoinase A n=1 Tax=Caldanaerobacter subterraneus subsp. tengcongensis (strain DSM 15242 / JCM 11007 / NBRC 100824 / MB4) TaxID=273068 RepID=Q8RAT0_CALS4|nr:hydantoinase/oxoprolinase family protein [Caldanaerobacter subterraneus]AAM24356.1 N-methylhydaintoinase A [Caldanaerobacter subterraneus subsp. tengcongensis MB4]MCS3916098.1 N-methylhydantoinase A/oxoprolinase/acetone carboxylase beta subunit [Caldanaerobacter subterraneus subsp. tengcongensis MB4]
MIIGLDMGGTNIDGVIVEKGKIIKTIKKPTNRDNLFNSIWTALKELLSGYDNTKIERINLSTTVSTNAIVENKLSPVGMIIQPGPGLPYDFLACGDENVFISGYIDYRGEIIKDFNLFEIENAIKLFKEKNIKAYAVVTKFSIRNPSIEIKIKEILENEIPNSFVTMGHTISGKLNFPRRVYTSYLNSAVHSIFNEFLNNIKKSLEKEGINAPVFILKADGGTMNISTAEKKPVETILSGPAASLMGINAMLPTNEDAILLDIGGTTTDIFFLADGVPLFEPWGIRIGKYKTLIRAIYSVSIGLGGDSSICVRNGRIKIGPQREGVPYAFGGPKPTPTDAMITLELIDENAFSLTQDNVKKAYEAMTLLGKELNLSAKDMAKLILSTMGDIIKNKVDELLHEINSRPVYTVKELLYGKKIKPKLINIIGGPSKVLAPVLEEKFNLPCYYPKNYSVANAVGAALARPTTEITMLVDTSKKTLSVPELGLYEKITGNYTLDKAKEKALELVKKSALSLGASIEEIEAEIVEESSFNMVRGFYTIGKNMRIKAQVKPGLIQ